MYYFLSETNCTGTPPDSDFDLTSDKRYPRTTVPSSDISTDHAPISGPMVSQRPTQTQATDNNQSNPFGQMTSQPAQALMTDNTGLIAAVVSVIIVITLGILIVVLVVTVLLLKKRYYNN